MTITIRKGHLALLVALVALIAPATAVATHVFVDVDDAKFYAEATEWARDNEITTGSPAGSSTFKPDDPVTRGESVTFSYRYDQNVVQPALDDLEADIDAIPDGPPGPPGPTNVVVRHASFFVGAGAKGSFFVGCTAGEKATGGGFSWVSGATSTMVVVASAPADAAGSPGLAAGATPVSWYAEVVNGSGAGATGRVTVICASS